jgi:hypothetical protein
MREDLMKHGAFSWAELLTNDVEGAKKFYSQLLGWGIEKAPMEGMEYTIVKVGDEPVGGIMEMPPQAKECPPHWGSYITVENVDKTVAKAGYLGAKVVMPPTDIPDVGRFALLCDPQGAMFSVITYSSK